VDFSKTRGIVSKQATKYAALLYHFATILPRKALNDSERQDGTDHDFSSCLRKLHTHTIF
jgi:hypothetical protein